MVAACRTLSGLQRLPRAGPGKAHLDKVGKVTRAQLEEIAKIKMKDLNAADMDGAVKIIAGSARSIGLVVEGVV